MRQDGADVAQDNHACPPGGPACCISPAPAHAPWRPATPKERVPRQRSERRACHPRPCRETRGRRDAPSCNSSLSGSGPWARPSLPSTSRLAGAQTPQTCPSSPFPPLQTLQIPPSSRAWGFWAPLCESSEGSPPHVSVGLASPSAACWRPSLEGSQRSGAKGPRAAPIAPPGPTGRRANVPTRHALAGGAGPLTPGTRPTGGVPFRRAAASSGRVHRGSWQAPIDPCGTGPLSRLLSTCARGGNDPTEAPSHAGVIGV